LIRVTNEKLKGEKEQETRHRYVQENVVEKGKACP
jgi:hypothetical protein